MPQIESHGSSATGWNLDQRHFGRHGDVLILAAIRACEGDLGHELIDLRDTEILSLIRECPTQTEVALVDPRLLCSPFQYHRIRWLCRRRCVCKRQETKPEQKNRLKRSSSSLPPFFLLHRNRKSIPLPRPSVRVSTAGAIEYALNRLTASSSFWKWS